MAKFLTAASVPYTSSYELLSVYINREYGADDGLKTAIEGELAARKLPRPEPLPLRPPPPPPKSTAMSRATFIEYLLLIYTMTGLVYSWLYLPIRLIKGDFNVDRKHKIIQSGIALAYQAAEVAVFILLTNAPS